MLESKIEKKLSNEIKKLGGKTFKFTSPGKSGVPDRIVLLPVGRMYFIELKAPDKKLRALQEFRAKELRELGFDVRCIDTMKKVEAFIREVMNNAI